MNLLNYLNFGHIPTSSVIKNLYGKIFGHRNLIKRIQAPSILKAIAPEESDVILDYGCGLGYITIELAKKCKHIYGLDVTDLPTHKYLNQYANIDISNNPDLNRKILTSKKFDKILLSEVLPMIEDNSEFIKTIRDALKPNGEIIICNGTGHPYVQAQYKNNSKLKQYIDSKKIPASYDDYQEKLNAEFGTQRKKFHSKNEMERLLEQNGFKITSATCSPNQITSNYISRRQFNRYLKHGKVLSERFFLLNFILCSFLNLIPNNVESSSLGIIIQAKKK